jgi:tRNA (guanine-N7-)-methyltransferase
MHRTLACGIRQHANPLAARFRGPPRGIERFPSYVDRAAPLTLDIGSASGEWLLRLAQQDPGRNFLGTEVRHSLVVKSSERAALLPHQNCHFLPTNLLLSHPHVLPRLVRFSGSATPLATVSIMHPDPHWKVRHNKRRVVCDTMLQLLAHYMPQQRGRLFLQTDVPELHYAMRAVVQRSPWFRELSEGEVRDAQVFKEDPQLLQAVPALAGKNHCSLFGVATPREVYTLQTGGRIYRSCYSRNDAPAPDAPEVPPLPSKLLRAAGTAQANDDDDEDDSSDESEDDDGASASRNR